MGLVANETTQSVDHFYSNDKLTKNFEVNILAENDGSIGD